MKRAMTIMSIMAAASLAAAAITNVTHSRNESATQHRIADAVEAPAKNAIPDIVVVADNQGRTTAYTTESGDGPLPDVVVIAERQSNDNSRNWQATPEL